MRFENSEIASQFYQMADLLEIEGANPFRVRAYRKAARMIENHPENVSKMADDTSALQKIDGIGDDLAQKIQELTATGEISALEDLKTRVPPSLLRLLDIPGMGPKSVQKLHEALGITSLAGLQRALKDGAVSELEGFGEKTVQNIKDALESDSFKNQRTRLDIAEQFAGPLLAFLREISTVESAEIAGSYRRRRATVGDLDMLAVSCEGERVAADFVKYEAIDDVLSRGETSVSVRLRSGLQVDLRIVSPESAGAALFYFTGSKAHNIRLREMAQAQDMKINEYGVFRDGEQIAGETEVDIYACFDLPIIPPELRQDTGETTAAREGRLPELVTMDDLRGDLQMHTNHSDGHQTAAEMAEAAAALGHDYIAITDHSSYIGVTNGLDAAAIPDYLEDIEAADEEHPDIAVFKGIEVDILEDGSLDLPDELLAQMDLVVASIHAHFDLSEATQTERILRAMRHPHVNILAHPTTRKIGARDPIVFDLKAVMQAALEQKVFLEINASPERLDLRDKHIRLAKDLGLTLVISTDAHRKSDLENLKYGLYQARRGWAEATMILNTLPLSALKDHLDR
jgi:DNA polymerase (family 10)